MALRATLTLALCISLTAGGAWADTAQVSAAIVNLRSEPSTGSRVVTTLARGTRLEVLEAAGEWLKVRVLDTKAEGYVSRRLVEVTPAAAASPAAPAATLPVAPSAASSGAGPVAIDHRDVGCVVAGQYSKFDACFSPVDRVGRGRVLFRAAKTDPWYYVEMSRDGACYSAVLPKPKPQLKSFEYFVDVTDTAFGESLAPERAPDQFFAPNVVTKQEDCDKARKMALMVPRLVKPVVVGIARNPSGGVLTAVAAKALESQLSLTGFASDGVIVSGTGAAPSTSAGSTAAGGAAAGGASGAGGGIPMIAIVGGGVAAAGLVAVVAGGGGGDSSGGSSTGGGSGAGGAPSGVTGQWTGAAGGGNGLIFQFGVEGISCTQRYDISANLTQNGGAVSGSMTYSGRSFTCSAPAELQQIINSALIPGDSGGFPVGGTATDASVTLNIANLAFTGSYSRTTMDLSGRLGQDLGVPYTITLKLVRP